MVVNNANIMRIVINPTKNNSPFPIDPDAVEFF